VLLTPENSVQCQKAYGSDIIIPLDELRMYSQLIATIFHHNLANDVKHRTSHGKAKAAVHNCDTRAAPYHMGPEALRRSLDRTHRWELRSLKEHLVAPNDQAMYCVCGWTATPCNVDASKCVLPWSGLARR
jgi:queuine tRNA-ribosyltransferase